MADARTPPELLDFASLGAWIQVFKERPRTALPPGGTYLIPEGSGANLGASRCSSPLVCIGSSEQERSVRILLDRRQDLCQDPPGLRVQTHQGVWKDWLSRFALARRLFDI